MLTVLFLISIFYQGHAVPSYGKEFITAFPENIAYYYPSSVNNSLRITALYDGTRFTVTFNGSNVEVATLNTGSTKVIYLPTWVEEYKLNVSTKSVRVTSDKDITVFSVSKREDSVQTNVVPPLTNLGKNYQVSIPDYSEFILLLNNYNISNLTDLSSLPLPYNFFRVIVINADQQNNIVTVTQQQVGKPATTGNYSLRTSEFIQIESNYSVVQITAKANVSVLLTHPCLDTTLCRCNMIVRQIRPKYLQDDEFLVPPSYFSANFTRLLVTSAQSVELTYGSPRLSGGTKRLSADPSDILPIFPFVENGYQNVTTSQPVTLALFRPGSIVELLPTSMFSACFLVHVTSATKSEVLVIVETSEVSRVRVDWDYFDSQVKWNVFNGTGYSYAYVPLQSSKSHVIWHPTSQIAVYVFERMASWILYGGPAISINDEPDAQGCMVTPTIIEVGNKPMSWPESRNYCETKGAQLVSPSQIEYQIQMGAKLADRGVKGQAWIGLRRKLLTTEWYWQNNKDFAFTNWDEGQPADPETGMCASVLMNPGGNYTWTTARCCSTMKPVCYTWPHILQIVTQSWL